MKKRLVLALETAPTKAKKLTLPASWSDRRCDALRRLAAEKLGCTGAVELRVGARALGDDEPIAAIPDGALPCGGSPGYVLTPRGARAALAHQTARTPHEALFAGDTGVYASRRAILDFGDVAREGPGAPPPARRASQRALALKLLEAGHFATPEGTDARLAVAAAMAVDRRHFLERAPFYEDRPCYLGWTTVSAPSSHCRAARAPPGPRGRPRRPRARRRRGQRLRRGAARRARGGRRGRRRASRWKFRRSSRRCGGQRAARARRRGLPGGGCAFVAVAGDGRRGHAALAPYAAIHVGASCDEIPGALVDQLAVGGRLVMAVGAPDAPQRLVLVAKSATGLAETTLAAGFVMSPLR
ncbi:protein-L-isoaspartate (D-aspartate) O-methyltransferase [Aureococcus anophagefferens]|nr:protein-L-isoaspartate (D-aspartate) O-methyltransferase [Aureococcus anophagefferens]